MIIVKLMGGLGNQLFQYSFGKTLALKHGVSLSFDVSAIGGYASYQKRQLEILNFDPALVAASESEMAFYRKGKISKAIDLTSLYLGIRLKHPYLREPHFHFSPLAANAPADCYLDGYWQSERYFSEKRKELLQILTGQVSLSPENIQIADNMQGGNSVSIHVRKGDYVSVPKNKRIYAEPGADYYVTAMNKIKETVQNPVFYVFSDEPDWFRRNIRTENPVNIISHNPGNKSYQDLVLMSKCKHNIIANSSFSWWGAWLNEYPDKRVIAPVKWFKRSSRNTKDLVPGSWMKI
jgi:hypothetical protein